MRMLWLVQMSPEKRPSFSDIVFTLEGMEDTEDDEKTIGLGNVILMMMMINR